MQACATVLEMVEKRDGEDGGVEGGRVAQILIPNWVDNAEDECGGTADDHVVERVVLEVYLPDISDLSRLVFLFLGDCRIGAMRADTTEAYLYVSRYSAAGEMLPQRL